MNNPFFDKPPSGDEKDYEDYLGLGEAHHPPPKKFKPNDEDEEPEPKSADVFDTPESQEDTILHPIESTRDTPEEVASKDVFDDSAELVADSQEAEQEPRRKRAPSELSEELGEKSFMTDLDCTLSPRKMKWRGDERRQKESPKSSASTSSTSSMPVLEAAGVPSSPVGKNALTPVTKSSKRLSQLENFQIAEAGSQELMSTPKTPIEAESSSGAQEHPTSSGASVDATPNRRNVSNNEIADLLKIFEEKNLVFQPDFEKADRTRNLAYCDIPNVRTSTRNHQFSNIKSIEMRTPVLSEAECHAEMDAFLQAYKENGYWSFVMMLNKMYKQQFELGGLRRWYDAESERLGQDGPVDEKLADVVRLARMAGDVLPPKITRLQPGIDSVTLSQKQCAVLLAKAMFTADGFLQILAKDNDLGREKCKFLFAYFSTVSAQMPDGNVSFRLITHDQPSERVMVNDSTQFVVKMCNHLSIEESALCTQVDFANSRLGGGVLNNGMVQEEIRFLMCPEMIVSRWLLAERMSNKQAVSIVGAQVYSSYEGYGRTTKWAPLQPKHALSNNLEHRDKYLRLPVECLAIDAISFDHNSLSKQLETPYLLREIKKAIAGFSGQSDGFEDVPIWTGWWGCGAFNGNKALKFVIQMIAARIANRPLRFCTFGDFENSSDCAKFVRIINQRNISVGQLLHCLTKKRYIPQNPPENHVLQVILSELRG